MIFQRKENALVNSGLASYSVLALYFTIRLDIRSVATARVQFSGTPRLINFRLSRDEMNISVGNDMRRIKTSEQYLPQGRIRS